jgi:hypothetical protein
MEALRASRQASNMKSMKEKMSSSEHCHWQTLCNPNLVDQVEGAILALLRTAFRSPMASGEGRARPKDMVMPLRP